MSRATMQFHEVANIFPLMGDAELEVLAEDIAKNGLIDSIWTYQGKIIDGRNRYRACELANVEPRYQEWGGGTYNELVTFVVSLNLHRRHLTSSQRAVVGLNIKRQLEPLAREKQRESGQVNSQWEVSEKFQKAVSEPVHADEDAAKIAGTNAHYIHDIENIEAQAPEVVADVAAGYIAVDDAKKVAALPEEARADVVQHYRDGDKKAGKIALRKATRASRRAEVQKAPALPNNKYRVWYADPPWHYNNSGLDDYGHAERHYPTMTLDDLCAMGAEIQARCADNAVLFLWITSPLLQDGFKVIRAWGFKYKTSFVWDKVKHNFGHYNSVRHELLLVCTRGSCTPDNLKLFDSVQSIERSTKHSEKPGEFVDIIETLYTRGNRIELFARNQRAGWDTWGNQV